MRNHQKAIQTPRFLVVFLILFVSGCGPGQLFGPTLVPAPTITPTPTTGAIEGTVFLASDPEQMVADITVVLFSEGEEVAKTEADSEGHYRLHEVEAGTYRMGIVGNQAHPCIVLEVNDLNVRAGEIVQKDFKC